MRWTRYDNAKSISPETRDLRGMVRRMAIRFTDRVLWQITGHTLENGYVETVETEPFTGVGFYARPPEGSRTAEGILVRIGDAAHTALIAVRDEAVRALWAAILDAHPNVAAMFNTLAGVIVTHEGKVEARSLDGVARELAFKDELVAVDEKYADHIHLDSAGGPTGGPIASVLPNPAFPGDPMPFIEGDGLDDVDIVGTTVLKAE